MASHHHQQRERLALALAPNIGSHRYRQCQRAVDDLNQLWQCDNFSELGLHPNLKSSFTNHLLIAADHWLAWREQPFHHIVLLDDPDYPALLKEIPNPPTVLFIKGLKDLLHEQQIAIVGSRNATMTGIENAKTFAEKFSEAGFHITSGLANGIDTAAHRGALKHGQTIAVLGCGVDIIYPKKNRQLAEDILKNGALVSEYQPNTQPKPYFFPMRNRIISGLSQGVLIPEATYQSGSLITARHALEQNREVFAIPGSIHNPFARGCHQLIKQGALLVEQAEDCLHELNHPIFNHTIIEHKPMNECQLAKDKQLLVKCVGYDTTSVDFLIKQSNFPAKKVNTMLIELEMMGIIKSVPGGYQRRGA